MNGVITPRQADLSQEDFNSVKGKPYCCCISKSDQR